MSFILDALKKSETERQQQTGAEFANLPSGSEEAHPYKWLWILALLLAVNFAALLIVLLKPGKEAEDVAPAADVPAETAASQPVVSAKPSFEDQVAAARAAQADRVEFETATPEPIIEAAPAPRPIRAQSALAVPSIYELRAEGRLQLAELHLDIHVFSENPKERFVFINMVKHREGSQLAEGPVVNEITPEGVVLDYQGMTFLLPRE